MFKMSRFIGSTKNKSPSLIPSKLDLLQFSSASFTNFIKLVSTFSQYLLKVVCNFHLLEYILVISFELGYVICYSEVIVKSLKH